MSSNQDYNAPTAISEGPEECFGPQQNPPEEEVERPQEPSAEPEFEPELEPEQEPQPEGEPVASSSYQALYQPQDTQVGLSTYPAFIVGSPPVETFAVLNTISPSTPQVVDWNALSQIGLTAAVEIMAAGVNQPNNTLNAANTGPIPNQPTPAGNDGPINSPNPNTIGSTSKPPPRSPVTGVQVRGTTPTVAPNPNPNLAATSNTTLRPSRSQIQIASQPTSPSERRPTGPRLVAHDPIRGDIGHHVYSPGPGGEGEPVGVPIRRGSGGTVGRVSVSVPPRPRSVFSPVDGTVVENGLPSGPGSMRGSRFISTEEDVPPVSILFFFR